MSVTARQFAWKHLLPQILQAPVVMMPNVSQRLVQLYGDLVEGIAIEKVQAQSTTLVFCQGAEKSVDGRISDQSTEQNALFPSLTVVSEPFGPLHVKMGVE